MSGRGSNWSSMNRNTALGRVMRLNARVRSRKKLGICLRGCCGAMGLSISILMCRNSPYFEQENCLIEVNRLLILCNFKLMDACMRWSHLNLGIDTFNTLLGVGLICAKSHETVSYEFLFSLNFLGNFNSMISILYTCFMIRGE